MQTHTDQPADKRAVDADVLQIPPHGPFQLVGNGLRVPHPHGLGDQRRRRVPAVVRDLGERGSQKIVQHYAGFAIGEQAFAEVHQRRFEMLANARVRPHRVLPGMRANRGPQVTDELREHRVIEQRHLPLVGPTTVLGGMLQVVNVVIDDREETPTPGMMRIVRDFTERIFRRFEDAVRDALGQAQLPEQPGAPVVHTSPQRRLGLVEQCRQLREQIVEQRFTPTVSQQHLEHAGSERPRFDASQALCQLIAQQHVHRGRVHRIEHGRQQRGDPGGQRRCVFGRTEKAREATGQIDLGKLAANDFPGQKVVLDKVAQRDADPFLVARHDGGVRNRHPERVAEQRGDGEPVGESAHQRRLGECPQIPHRRGPRKVHVGEHKQSASRDEQRQCEPLHWDHWWCQTAVGEEVFIAGIIAAG